MKILVVGLINTEIKALEDRGHAVIDLPDDTSVTEVMERLIGCNSVIFAGCCLDYQKDSFFLGAACGLGKDVVVIGYSVENYWEDISSLSVFQTFESFMASAEGGAL